MSIDLVAPAASINIRDDATHPGLSSSCLGFLTIPVPDLQTAEAFYVGVLGFQVSRRYPATAWLSLDVDEARGSGLGLIEDKRSPWPGQACRIDFTVDDVDGLFAELEAKVKVVHRPAQMPWGSYKAVIEDPFGNQLGLVQRM